MLPQAGVELSTILKNMKHIIIITGAGKGIGKAIAIDFARAAETQNNFNPVLILVSRTLSDLEAVATKCRSYGADADIVQADIADTAQIDKLVSSTLERHGTIDCLVNNAGVGRFKPLTELTEEDFDFTFDTNVKGAFFVAQEVGKRMLARARGAAPGTYTGGRIVNIASAAGLLALPQISVYAMSKAAVIHMTRAMALEWGRYGINVNALCPGYIDTEINHHHWQTEAGQKLVQMLPRKRVGQPKDLDAVLMMLCANESHFVNGAIISADDGFGV